MKPNSLNISNKQSLVRGKVGGRCVISNRMIFEGGSRLSMNNNKDINAFETYSKNRIYFFIKWIKVKNFQDLEEMINKG